MYCLHDYIKNGFDIKLTVAIDYTVRPYIFVYCNLYELSLRYVHV